MNALTIPENVNTGWPEPVDLFAAHAVPTFPLDCLPDSMAEFATHCAAQSGFDPGAYAFASLVTAANTIDHRARMYISDTYTQPPFLWGGLAEASGMGKSAVLKAATAPAVAINDQVVRQSRKELAEWMQLKASAAAGVAIPERPPWRQRIALDTTVAALGDLLMANPEGINFFFDEMTEFIGRMDAFSGSGATSLDRPIYLRSYDGGSVTINRRSNPMPLIVDNFSVGILAGVQPEKLAQMFRQKGDNADGLYQRFLMYRFNPAGLANFSYPMPTFTQSNYAEIINQLHEWNQDGTARQIVQVSPEVRDGLQQYTNDLRVIAQRTPAPRLREHLSRFNGFCCRLTFALHLIECARAGHSRGFVEPETFDRVLRIMGVMYRHAEAVYTALDNAADDVLRLVRSAGEAILHKEWDELQRGDLTQYATGWRNCTDAAQAEAAIDRLIEYGWLWDVTPPPVTGRRGRKSEGLYRVNPVVHLRFAEQRKRVRVERMERYDAIQRSAQKRREGN